MQKGWYGGIRRRKARAKAGDEKSVKGKGSQTFHKFCDPPAKSCLALVWVAKMKKCNYEGEIQRIQKFAKEREN